jgi:diguanylate cyclase (GGDEF)-like protein
MSAMKPAVASRIEDPRDEGRLADLTSGYMWVSAGLGGLLALALPGAARAHLGWELAIAAFATGWGAISFWLATRPRTMSLTQRAWATAGMMPVVAVALWASGGAASFLQPILLFTALFISYFFPPRLTCGLVAGFVAAYATPLLYDDRVLTLGYPSRLLMFALSVAGMATAMQVLKRRLLRAEARQRRMAERDPLTGLHNRRSFDAALVDQIECGDAALVLWDFDGFKAINDVHGHPMGDAVLRTVADVCSEAIRDVDHLARLGGDEFALIAPGAGEQGIERIVSALEQAILTADMPSGLEITATFGWALAPHDAVEPAELLRCADLRLLAGKRDRRLRIYD